MPSLEAYTALLKEIWENGWLTNDGPLLLRLEQELKNYLKAKNISLFSNGHLALDSAIRVLELKGEVITTPFTFASTPHAISMNGLVPVFCDIDEYSYNINASQIERLITDRTCAILPVHVYGTPCDVVGIAELAKKHDIPVIYDAAHAFGVEVGGVPITNYGTLSMLSFHATKVFHTVEGGALLFNDSSLEKPLRLAKNFGIENSETIVRIALNAKMNEFQAAMGLLNLESIDSQINARKVIYETYLEEFRHDKGILIREPLEHIRYNYSYAPILVDEAKYGKSRDELKVLLESYNIFARKYFFPLLTSCEPYRDCRFETPIAEYVSKRILCLPISSNMTPEQAYAICNIIKEQAISV